DGHPRAGRSRGDGQGAQGRRREEREGAEGRGRNGHEGQAEEEGEGRGGVRLRMLRGLHAAALAALLAACATVGSEPRGDRAPIDHVVVLFLENRPFDHLFGTYPGADGLANYAGKQTHQRGVPAAMRPQPLVRAGKPDRRFQADLPNEPFPMLRFVQPLDLTNNPIHRFYHMQRQYGAGADGIAMGTWVAEGTSGGITMGYYDRAASPVQWRLADEFVLLDRYFQSIHGGAFADHYFLGTAAVAPLRDAPPYRAVAAAHSP